MNRQSTISRISIIFLAFIGFLGVWVIQDNIDIAKQRKLTENLVEELTQFPPVNVLKPITIEYQSAMADLIWLRTIQYYGQHLMSDRKFIWLNHILETLTGLDPLFIDAYDFGSKILAWDSGQVPEALALLDRGIINNPLDWKIAFGYGFIVYMTKIKDNYVDAGYYFEIASNLPNTWNITKRWAAYSFGRGGARDLAIEIWSALYYTTQNSAIKDLAKRQMNKLGFYPQ
jgi:hypothetical protein